MRGLHAVIRSECRRRTAHQEEGTSQRRQAGRQAHRAGFKALRSSCSSEAEGGSGCEARCSHRAAQQRAAAGSLISWWTQLPAAYRHRSWPSPQLLQVQDASQPPMLLLLASLTPTPPTHLPEAQQGKRAGAGTLAAGDHASLCWKAGRPTFAESQAWTRCCDEAGEGWLAVRHQAASILEVPASYSAAPPPVRPAAIARPACNLACT